MTDEKPEQATPGTTEKFGKHCIESSQRLLALGFHPQAPIYRVLYGFEPHHLMDALCQGYLDAPNPLPFQSGDVERPVGPIVPMQVELVQVVYPIYSGVNLDGTPGEPGRAGTSDLYLRGWLFKSALNPDGELIRMHAYITDIHSPDREADIQILRETPSQHQAMSEDGCLVTALTFDIEVTTTTTD